MIDPANYPGDTIFTTPSLIEHTGGDKILLDEALASHSSHRKHWLARRADAYGIVNGPLAGIAGRTAHAWWWVDHQDGGPTAPYRDDELKGFPIKEQINLVEQEIERRLTAIGHILERKSTEIMVLDGVRIYLHLCEANEEAGETGHRPSGKMLISCTSFTGYIGGATYEPFDLQQMVKWIHEDIERQKEKT